MEKILNKKNKRSNKVFSIMEEIYNRAWYIEEEEKSRKCKESSSRVWGENKYRSKMTGKVRYDRRKRL